MGEGRRNDRFFIIFLRSRLLLLLAPFFLSAQNTEEIIRKQEEKKRATPVLLEINGNLYKEHANYLNAGAGFGYFFSQKKSFGSIGLGYNFRVKEKYYKVGFERSDNISFFGTSVIHLNDFHIATGKRYPSRRWNLSYFYGGSIYTFHQRLNLEDPVKAGVGLYGEASAFFKPVYDIGIGITAYTNVNFHAPVAGARLEFYFSGAYRGKKER